jgi:hypothetical protein
MLSHLRAQHRSVEKGIKDIDSYLVKTTEGHVKLDDNGRARIQYGNIGIHVVVLPDHNLVIFKAFINLLPDPEGGKILPLYYHLLDMSDEPQTGMAYFAIVAAEEIDMERDVISVETKRPIVDISLEEFKMSVSAVGEVANAWMEKLEKEFDAPPVP